MSLRAEKDHPNNPMLDRLVKACSGPSHDLKSSESARTGVSREQLTIMNGTLPAAQDLKNGTTTLSNFVQYRVERGKRPGPHMALFQKAHSTTLTLKSKLTDTKLGSYEARSPANKTGNWYMERHLSGGEGARVGGRG
ncbi:hypothetical protein L3Q82_002972 [Scortum barcoo]|uniref:Uncharacterized protein n=1 Tax=Scortum barcoo TaxID=214431 RepID=A0ACB8VRG2_9TELE|nr:hypothetical protein L3Q82_002972 [Scortum barcoo]